MKQTIRNNYNLSEKDISKFIELFPYTREKKLSIMFGLNNNQISSLRVKFNLEKNKNVFVLTPTKLEDLISKFYSYNNDELCDRYGITRSQLDYIRKKEGLRKRVFKKFS